MAKNKNTIGHTSIAFAQLKNSSSSIIANQNVQNYLIIYFIPNISNYNNLYAII